MILPLILLADTAAAAPPTPLELTCRGSGFASKEQTARVTTTTSDGEDEEVEKVQASTFVRVPFEDQVEVRLFSGDDRIRMPGLMVPALSGGNAGWFKLRRVVANDREITGNAAVSIVSNPRIRLDRIAGTISISGSSGEFRGTCSKIAPDTPRVF